MNLIETFMERALIGNSQCSASRTCIFGEPLRFDNSSKSPNECKLSNLQIDTEAWIRFEYFGLSSICRCVYLFSVFLPFDRKYNEQQRQKNAAIYSFVFLCKFVSSLRETIYIGRFGDTRLRKLNSSNVCNLLSSFNF